MCDSCGDFLNLLSAYEDRNAQKMVEGSQLTKAQLDIVIKYIHSFSQRQCMCVFRDLKNLDRFFFLTQAIIYLGYLQLKDLHFTLSKGSIIKKERTECISDGNKNESNKTEVHNGPAIEIWDIHEKEKLFAFLSKLFLMNFPLYQALKSSGHSKTDDSLPFEVAGLNLFCDLNDMDIPIYLIRNVAFFAQLGGVQAVTACFDNQTPETLPVSVAHALISVICNLKLWLNLRSIMSLFVPLRSKVLRYMCILQDKDLPISGIKHMAEYMWNAVKEPFDSPPTFDRDGLELAFKYFTSSTLTMRLAGIAQINSYISVYNDLCHNESVVEVETLGQSLAEWLIHVNIISHIFGPNLHVEVIKQSHMILNFLAMECKITNEHIDIIWQAAQLKHCSKQVHDLLPPFINNLETGPVLHLYNLLCKLEPKDHTEQSLILASALIKFMWTSGGVYNLTDELTFLNMGKVAISNMKLIHHHELSSSENSISNSEVDSSQPSEAQKTPSEGSEGPTPCKRPRKQRRVQRHRRAAPMPHRTHSSDESIKVEEGDEEEDDEEDDEEEEDEEEDEEEEEEDDEEEDEDDDEDALEESQLAIHNRLLARRKIFKRGLSQFMLHEGQEKGGAIKAKYDDMMKNVKFFNKEMDKLVSDAEKTATNKFDSKKHLKEENSKNENVVKNENDQEQKGNDDKTLLDAEGVVQSSGQDKKITLATEKIKGAVDTDHDADEEKSVNEEPKEGRKKVLKKKKAANILPSRSHVKKNVHKLSEDDETTSEGEIKKEAKKEANTKWETKTEGEIEDMSVDEGGSYSSRLSNKSEKNMADFEGEDSPCEEELAQYATQQAQLSNLAFHSRFHGKLGYRPGFGRLPVHFKPDNVCKPGNTLLWDLLQDNKVEQLGENLAVEAEKILSNLLCYNTEKPIRMKFIEGCLENLSRNWSVVVSLRLLPKLFLSFQEFRGMNTHAITTWAEKNLCMMKHFFNNLQVYSLEGPKFYSHQTEVNVRLRFLSSVYSPIGSPEYFRLSITQIDTLWSCLASDPQCSDELFSWLLTNVQNREHQHALGDDALKYLYLKKLPSLPPEMMSMVGLTLFQHLHSMVRSFADVREVDRLGIDYLWKVALKANNTDISMSAIQYINQYYMSRQLENESEFITECLSHLSSASKELTNAEESSLLCIQRALLLLKTHLETFKRRYAYHLRRWMLEGKSVGSHVQMSGADKGTIRVIVQPAGTSEKITFEMSPNDFVAELRAEVVKWWESAQLKRNKEDNNDTPVLGALLTDGPIRLISQGQELTTDFDEKTLGDMMFKDSQLVYMSMGASRPQKRRDFSDSPSVLPPPPRENLPTLLLLQPAHFEQLFQLMQSLSTMKTTVKGGHDIPHTKAQVLSRRVWDILTLLPTSPKLLEGFQNLHTSDNVNLEELLDPSSPQKLMYSLYIVESLCRPLSHKKHNNGINVTDSSDAPTRPWSETFVRHGGLRHLFDIFMTGTLQRGDGSEWQQDCLASLLKLLCQLGRKEETGNGGLGAEGTSGGSDGVINLHRGFRRRTKKSHEKPVPRLNDDMIQMLNTDGVMSRLTSILNEASMPRDPNHYKTGFWGRAQVVSYAMALLVSWVHSVESVRSTLFSCQDLSSGWLRRLVLEDPEPAVRREVCTALYRLSLYNNDLPPSSSSSSSSVSSLYTLPPPSLAAPMLTHLLDFLHVAESMGPQKYESLHNAIEDGKEPYGPACRDYFWLLCRLVDNLPEDLIKESIEDPQGCILDIDSLARTLANSIVSRDYLEKRHNTIEDNALIGLLNLMTNVIKHCPPFKTSREGGEFLNQLFEFLFALPNPKMRFLPKCKSQAARLSTFDLIVEMVRSSPENHLLLHQKLLSQHQQNPHYPYPWDYWPHEDGRSDCGYVGLTNLGATCYMASCMQHLYMMPQARTSILDAKCTPQSKHEETLKELQRMFAYLMESERKAYNPRSFCKVYTMDHQPLNTGEQKDMAEFFIDLVSKLEEMTPETKKLVKTLFGGVISNNVVSLDCGHVSRTLEEFYTVRCQVTDMRNLYESLDEVTVKDTLEGDNMYTCSQCGKKVRAEKRACFKKLPHILCFNTMRYTFNMLTMLKEKVNTLFSFPLRLDMSGYVEKHLMPQHYQEEKRKSQMRESEEKVSDSEDFNEKYEYELIGVTVHTGTADGGHYYSFIRDRTTPHRDKWFLFNDAEVKPFDPNQIAAECFGGEMTSKTYDSVNDKFMDFSFEKTNSAYMLFYEWCSDTGEQRNADPKDPETSHSDETKAAEDNEIKEQQEQKTSVVLPQFELCKDLEDWIWQDNMHFLRDKSIFEHTYFNFMWQICSQIPQTLFSKSNDVTELAAQLSTSFFLETYIHAKEKPMMVQWMELLTKQFVASRAACEWFLGHMAVIDWWPVQILIKCPNQMVRQMFQRLCIHVIQQLRQSHVSRYLKTDKEDDDPNDPEKIGNHSCVTRFVRKLLTLLEHNTTKAHLKHLTEYFIFLYEFSKMGESESQFLLSIQAISTMVNFYLGHKATDFVEVVSEEEDEEDMVPLPSDKYKPASLEKMITLIATLTEKSRSLGTSSGVVTDGKLLLSQADLASLTGGGKWFPFIHQQIRDAINLNQTRNLIFSLCQYNDRLAQMIVQMIFQTIARHPELCQPFLKLLSLLTESTASTSLNGDEMPCFSQYILQGVWDVVEMCPTPLLEWLSVQVTRNAHAHSWVLQSLDKWVEPYLMQSANQRVRTAAAYLLVALVPNPNFRQSYRQARGMLHQRELMMTPDAQSVLHTVYTFLLRKLVAAKKYSDIQEHGPSKLTAFFTLLLYFCPTRTEKLMFSSYFMDLWNLFLPNLSEPSISVHYNKQALLSFWHHVCVDCPENVLLILNNPSVTKNIAFNYILADHDDQDVVLFNRAMLPAYYGILRMCCQQSRQFTRHLANHQNLNWAFKNITPYSSQYQIAFEELFKLMQIFATKYPDMTEEEINEVNHFRKATMQLYLTHLDARSSWMTFISAMRILVETEEEKLLVVYNGGIQMLFESFQTLHGLYHDGSSCHVITELMELLGLLMMCLKTLGAVRGASGPLTSAMNATSGTSTSTSQGETSASAVRQHQQQQLQQEQQRNNKDAKSVLLSCKDWMEAVRKLATLQNSYNPPELRSLALDLLKEIVIIIPREMIQVLTPMLSHCHSAFQDSQAHPALPMGPYFPRKGIKPPSFKVQRPVRPIVQMAVPNTQIEPKGQNEEYDMELLNYFSPYHNFIDIMCRLAINHNCMSDSLIQLSAIVGYEGVPLHMTYFPKLWLEIYSATHLDKKYISALLNNNFFIDYIESTLLDERTALNDPVIYKFLTCYFPKVASRVLSDHTCQTIEMLVMSLNQKAKHVDVAANAATLNADLRALYLVYSNVDVPIAPPDTLVSTLNCLHEKIAAIRPIKSEPSENTKSDVNVSPPENPTTSNPLDNSESSNISVTSSPHCKPSDWLSELDSTIVHLIAIINKPA